MTNPGIKPFDSFLEFQRDDIEQSISRRFEAVARTYPDRIAVSAQENQYSYDQLNRAANRVARSILSHCRNQDVPVALMLEQGAPQIITTLGALKAGRFYVPLDPTNPTTRNEYMLHDSAADIVLTNENNIEVATALAGPNRLVLNLDEITDDICEEDLADCPDPGYFAYILYTSGSTGNPKGIVQNHRNILHNVLRHTNAFRIRPDDRQTLLYTSSVYGGQRDMFNALLNGASLHVYVVKNEGIEGLAEWLVHKRISIYCSVTTVFRQLVARLSGLERFDDLRLIKLGGEATSIREVNAFKKYFSPDCIMHCGLGTTETGLVRNYFIGKSTEINANTVPLGYPVDDMDIMLLNDAGNPQSEGATGEIAVRSRYLSLGYWRKPDLTRLAFIADAADGESRIYRTGDMGFIHADGCLEHRGRRDHQIKVRGNRIETVEVEGALLGLESVKEAVVIGLKANQETDMLAAYLVPSREDIPSANDIWLTLANILPEFMIPSYFMWLESLPLLPNGKIDRQALPKSAAPQVDHPFIAPTTDLEIKIANIWRELLTLERIGINENFFVIGGHSLLASQVISRINRCFHIRLPQSALFENQTIASLAQAVVYALVQVLPPIDLAVILDNIEALPDSEVIRLVADKTKDNPL